MLACLIDLPEIATGSNAATNGWSFEWPPPNEQHGDYGRLGTAGCVLRFFARGRTGAAGNIFGCPYVNIGWHNHHYGLTGQRISSPSTFQDGHCDWVDSLSRCMDFEANLFLNGHAGGKLASIEAAFIRGILQILIWPS